MRARKAELTQKEVKDGMILLWVIHTGLPVQTAAIEGADQGDGQRYFEFPNLERELTFGLNRECPKRHSGVMGVHCWEKESDALSAAIWQMTSEKALAERKMQKFTESRCRALAEEGEESE